MLKEMAVLQTGIDFIECQQDFCAKHLDHASVMLLSISVPNPSTIRVNGAISFEAGHCSMIMLLSLFGLLSKGDHVFIFLMWYFYFL